MRVTGLKLTNVRSIMTAELGFQPGFNLVVGENGVGKTTLIDALAICLFEFVRVYNKPNRWTPRTFSDDDIRVDTEILDVECGIDAAGSSYYFVMQQLRGQDARRPATFIGSHPSIAENNRRNIEPEESQERPLAVMYSPTRAVRLAESQRWPRLPIGGVSRAYEGALLEREVPLGYFANWMKVRQAFNAEALIGVERAVRRFLPGYGRLHLGGPDDHTLLIDHRGSPLPERYLSHGERSILAVVLDLTRRLGEANPGRTDPAAEAGAVVLIDEIDLHLHPKWQREIVRKLTETFPRCQFIATTHSPQVIGEVEHDRIQILAKDGAFSPTHSFGVDASRVLEEIMEAAPRNRKVRDMLSRASHLIDGERFNEARELLGKLAERLGSNDPDVIGLETLLDFVEGKD